VNHKEIEENFDSIIQILIKYLENPKKINDVNIEERILICNNSCKSIGIMSVKYSIKIQIYIDQIMDKLLKILCVPRVNYNLN